MDFILGLMTTYLQSHAVEIATTVGTLLMAYATYAVTWIKAKTKIDLQNALVAMLKSAAATGAGAVAARTMTVSVPATSLNISEVVAHIVTSIPGTLKSMGVDPATAANNPAIINHARAALNNLR